MNTEKSKPMKEFEKKYAHDQLKKKIQTEAEKRKSKPKKK